MESYKQAMHELTELMESKTGIANGIFCRVVTTAMIVLLRMGDYRKTEEFLAELIERLRKMYHVIEAGHNWSESTWCASVASSSSEWRVWRIVGWFQTRFLRTVTSST